MAMKNVCRTTLKFDIPHDPASISDAQELPAKIDAIKKAITDAGGTVVKNDSNFIRTRE